MKRSWTLLVCLAMTAAINHPSTAHDLNAEHHLHLAQAVVPEAERKLGKQLMKDGPTKSSGISAVNVLGTLPLDGEFKSSNGLVMRVREIVTEPGGVVAVHQHNNRPGIAYVLSGEMTEHRASDPTSNIKKTGDVAMESSGVVHWWENRGSVPSRAIVVDIVPAQ